MNWAKELQFPVTICDRDGVVVFMNDKSAELFEKRGGMALMGQNLLDCHPEPSRSKLQNLLKTGATNTYTIEKSGARKLIHQSPWFENGVCAGLIEIAIPLPAEMPHFNRDAKQA